MLHTTLAKAFIQKDQVDIVDRLSRKEFYRDYVNQSRPVVIRGMTKTWKALEWNAEYFQAKASDLPLAVKTGNVAEGKRERLSLSDYIQQVEYYEDALAREIQVEKPGYLHDVPFFNMFPKFKEDIEPFPVHLFPKWYQGNWHDFIQFFMGPTGSLTPLHFDTLGTNNLFFQIVGQKKFILIPADQKDLCYIKGWRWAQFDPSNPDFTRFPKGRHTTPMEVTLEAGDILFMPAGMLHQVHGLTHSISFNIDWHTSRTALKGLRNTLQGAPKQNNYYNLLSVLGVTCGIPTRLLFPYYKSYLNYVS